MATPKPGEIRCPTCHRSTPPAAYCTQCGSAIPSDARARPRGMDRDELQDRIRARRSGGDPYRRGYLPDDPGYERFEPEPDDELARRPAPEREDRPDNFDERAAAAALPPSPSPRAPEVDRRDLTRDTDDWTSPIPPAAAPDTTAETTRAPRADDVPLSAYTVPGGDDAYTEYDDDAVGYPYEYDAWEDRRDRRSGTGAFAIIGFLALGVLALLGGAVLAGVFSSDEPVGQASPTPIVESTAPSVSVAPSVAASVAPSVAASAAPPASGEPIVFPDGFVAEAQPCFPGSANNQRGCGSNGQVNGGQVEIWVGFQNGNSSDVIGAEIVGPEGNTVGEGSIDLATIGCRSSCNGYTWFNFSNLEAGTYEVRVTRNGDPASNTSFEVT